MKRAQLLLAPVIIPQALWVAARATRLPEAAGPRSGTAGQGKPVRILLIGDSSVAGVGVERQDDALSGRLCEALSPHYEVSWTVIAQSGATVASTLRTLHAVDPMPCDAVALSLGVNDTKNGVSRRAWQIRYAQLLDLVTEKFRPRGVCVSGLPPVRHFPLLPWPLNSVLGARAELFDADLAALCATRANTTYLPLEFPLDLSKMASDGFHPGAEVYRDWAGMTADVLRRFL